MNTQDILNRIKEIRKQRSITQKEIALKLGVEQSVYSLLENGKLQMSLDRLFDIVEILDVSIADLIVLDYSKNKETLKDIEDMESKLKDIKRKFL